MRSVRVILLLLSATFSCVLSASAAQAPVVVTTNTTIRIMAANTSSGNNQRYEAPGIRIFKGLAPDVVAIQEFNYSSTNGAGINTTAALREMIDSAFGTNFVYYRESGKTIPNGIISRYPILSSGVWDDTQLTDREFVWARIDIPGTNDLYVVSIHMKASSGSEATRASQATALKTLIQSNFPTNAFIIVAGDTNIGSSSEDALTTFTSFLRDTPIPTDGFSNSSTNMNTNAGRSERYDYVFPSPSLNSNRVATVVGTKTFANGLVFDSRVYSPLSDVSPVQSGDSGVTGMQHMAVVKDFKITYTTTNSLTIPELGLTSTNILRWQGTSNLTYSIQTSSNLTSWNPLGTATSTGTNYGFTNQTIKGPQLFYRVTYP